MKLSFFIVFLLIILASYGSVFFHGLSLLPHKALIRWSFGIGYLLLFLALFAGLLLEHKMGIALTRVVTFAGYTFLVSVLFMLFSFLITDLIALANRIFHFAPNGLLAFRQYFALGSILFLVVLLTIGHYRFLHPAVEKLDLTVEKPLQHKSIRIVAASDIHLGSSIGKKQLHRYVQLINSRQPDLILLPGDIVDRSFGPVLEQKLEEELRMLKAPLGVYAVSGNHEYFSGVPDQIAEYLQKANITVLRDTAVKVANQFWIIGRNDKINPERKPLSGIVQHLDTALPRILLDHQPYHLEEAVANGIDLQVSGHTHNGQFFPGNLLVKKIFENGYGYLKKSNTHVYVSSGLGIWGPQYRIGSQSEIVEITLHY